MRIRRDVVLRRLIAARDLISTKDNWIQGSEAVDANGEDVNAEDSTAVRFCAVGAIRRVTFADVKRRGETTYSNQYGTEVERRVDNEVKKLGLTSGGVINYSIDSIVDVNDKKGGHSRRRVISIFNKAIATLEEELA